MSLPGPFWELSKSLGGNYGQWFFSNDCPIHVQYGSCEKSILAIQYVAFSSLWRNSITILAMSGRALSAIKMSKRPTVNAVCIQAMKIIFKVLNYEQVGLLLTLIRQHNTDNFAWSLNIRTTLFVLLIWYLKWGAKSGKVDKTPKPDKLECDFRKMSVSKITIALKTISEMNHFSRYGVGMFRWFYGPEHRFLQIVNRLSI